MPNRQERRRQERLEKKRRNSLPNQRWEPTKPQGWGMDLEQTEPQEQSGDASTRLDELQGQNEAIIFRKIIPPETCQRIIKLGDGRWTQAETFVF